MMSNKVTMLQMSVEDCDLLTDRLTELLNENQRLENELEVAQAAVEHQMAVINMLFVKLNQLEGKVLHPMRADPSKYEGDGHARPKRSGPH